MKRKAQNTYKSAKYIIASALLSSAAISPAMAQSFHPSQNYGARDFRAGASFVIPLGGIKKKANSKPRVEFSLQQSRIEKNRLQLDFNSYSLQNAPITNPNIGRIGFTLDKNPTMLVNGRTFNIEKQKNLTSGETALVVLGILGVTVIVSAVIIADSVEDIFEPD